MRKVLGGYEDSGASCTVKCGAREDITCTGGGCDCETNVGCSCSSPDPGHAKRCADSPLKS